MRFSCLPEKRSLKRRSVQTLAVLGSPQGQSKLTPPPQHGSSNGHEHPGLRRESQTVKINGRSVPADSKNKLAYYKYISELLCLRYKVVKSRLLQIIARDAASELFPNMHAQGKDISFYAYFPIGKPW